MTVTDRPYGRGLQRIAVGPLQVFPHERIATLNNKSLDLSRTEFEVLKTLAGDPRRAFSREELWEETWGYQAPKSRSLDTHVSRLRKKLNANGDNFVRTVRGYGYCLAPRGYLLPGDQLACPNCGSTELGTIESISGLALGGAYVAPDGTRAFDHDGYTEVFWDCSDTEGVQCRACSWENKESDWLDHLVAEEADDE